jgi:5'-phosphate synthase pdxT subunit
MTVGVMGYQGGSDIHIAALTELGIPCKKIYKPEDFAGLQGLIMPGGESSVQYKYAITYGIKQAICEFASSGKPIFGTCAGVILLSRYQSPKVTGFGLLDVNVERNTYGRQIVSGIHKSDQGREVLFIRAPGIIEIGSGVEVIDTYLNKPILVKQGNIYGATFHPEAINLDETNLLWQIFGEKNA